jgi:hypothetical protein
VHKVLSQTVPDSAKNDVLIEMEQYLGALIKQVDSSLLEQWEKLRNPEYTAVSDEELKPPGAEEAAADITKDTRVFRTAVRTHVLQFLRALANGDYAGALELLEPHTNTGEDSSGWSEGRLEAVMNEYYQDHERLRLDPEARNAKHSYFESTGPGPWKLQQTLVDPAESNDWFAGFEIDLVASKARGSAVLQLTGIARIA